MRRTELVAALLCALLAGPTVAAAEAPIPGAIPGRWLVELAGAPTSQGGDPQGLAREHDAFRSAARRAGLRYAEAYAYQGLWNGLAVEVDAGDLGRLQALSGVRAIHRDVEVQPALATSLAMIAADVAHSSLSLTGAGVRVGVIDSVTVPPGGSASVDVTVTPGADGAGGRGLYGGYVFFTPRDGGPRYSVPYLGVEGDYQEIVVFARPGFPMLTNASLAADDHFTLEGGDVPFFLVHLRHQVRRIRFEVSSTSGKSWQRAFPDFEYFPRSATRPSFFVFRWDGTTTSGRKTRVLPDGEYVVTISVQKANGDDSDPAHWERATLGPFTIDRPGGTAVEGGPDESEGSGSGPGPPGRAMLGVSRRVAR